MARVGQLTRASQTRAAQQPRITIDRTPVRNKALIYWEPGKIVLQKRNGIDTDQIIPSEHCVSGDMRDLWQPWGDHVFAHMDPNFHSKVRSGQTFIVAGENFGIGSSREMAPAGLLRAAKDMGQEGKIVVIAKSFGAIFRKNSINLGLHLCECPQAVDDAKEGDEFEFDPISRLLKNITQGRTYQPKSFTQGEEAIRLGGGLVGGAKKALKTARHRPASPETIAERFPQGAAADRMSLAQQILYAHRVDRRTSVEPGQTVDVIADFLPASDGTAPFAISVFLEVTGNSRRLQPWNPGIVNDHFVPCANAAERAQLELGRQFAERFRLQPPRYSEVGDGIFHFHFPYSGLVLPGMVIAGADSHTTTYGAYGAFATGVGSTELGVGWALKSIPITVGKNRRVTFQGELAPWVTGKDVILRLLADWGIAGTGGANIDLLDPERRLAQTDRHTIANMAVEGNALSAIFPQDETTDAFFAGLGISEFPYPRLRPGSRVEYHWDQEIDLSRLTPLIARPPRPYLGVVGDELSQEKVRIAQAFLGSCTNGSYPDLLQAALVLNASGQTYIAAGIRMIVFPGNKAVVERMQQAEVLLGGQSVADVLISFGAELRMPSCGHCFKPSADSPAPGEVIIGTSNRNWENRQGKDVQTYLASPFNVAASAVAGFITTPNSLGIAWDPKFRGNSS